MYNLQKLYMTRDTERDREKCTTRKIFIWQERERQRERERNVQLTKVVYDKREKRQRERHREMYNLQNLFRTERERQRERKKCTTYKSCI